MCKRETEVVTADLPFLLVRRDMIGMLEPPFIDLDSASQLDADTYVVRDDGRRFENWERSVASQVGLAVADRYALRVGIDAIDARIKPAVRYCGRSSQSDPASACTISAWSSAGSSPFSRTAKRRARLATGCPR
jgi:selenocysteine lyase/cysteine desulfurase